MLEQIEDEVVNVEYVLSEDQRADIHGYYNAMRGDRWSSMLVTSMDDPRIIAIQEMLDYTLNWRRCIEIEMDALGLENTKDQKARTKYLERHFLPPMASFIIV